jgi:hypothetical protein
MEKESSSGCWEGKPQSTARGVIEVLSISQPQIRKPHWFSITAQNEEHLRQGFLSDKT